MERIQVESSNLASIGYDEDSMTMEVEFTNGHVYQYFDVPAQVHRELMGAGSHGQFFNAHVKGYYRYARVG